MEYMPFGELLVDEHLNSYNTPFKFNSKELDEETGNYYYGARYYNPKTSIWLSVDPLADKYPGWSPYNYCMQNPVILTDPTGMSAEWIPGVDENNNVTITKEEGDTEDSLSKFMGAKYSKEQISSIYQSMNDEGEINLTSELGGVFQIMTDAMNDAQSQGLPSTEGFLNGTESSKGENYNCWGATIAINDGKKLEGNGVGTGIGIPMGSTFKSILEKDYSPISRENAVVGETALRYANNIINSDYNGHGAIFMGIDRSGNEYLFSKNGWEVAPAIFPKVTIDNIYGSPGGGNNAVKGINPGESGYYQKKYNNIMKIYSLIMFLLSFLSIHSQDDVNKGTIKIFMESNNYVLLNSSDIALKENYGFMIKNQAKLDEIKNKEIKAIVLLQPDNSIVNVELRFILTSAAPKSKLYIYIFGDGSLYLFNDLYARCSKELLARIQF